MKYYKKIDQQSTNVKIIVGTIYREDDTPNNTPYDLKTYHKNFPERYIEVSEKEYLQQELLKGVLIVDQYYTVNSTGVIFKNSGTQKATYFIGANGNGSLTRFERNGGGFISTSPSTEYRLSTLKEIEWIEACNKADKFIPMEENKVLVTSIESIKVGDILIIERAPSSWASLLHNKCALHLNIYPYTCTVKEIQRDSGYTGMTCGNYGWSLNSLISGQKTYKVIKNIKQEEMKKVKYYVLTKLEYKVAAEKIMGFDFGFDNRVSVDICITRLKDAEVLDLWFKPIYEDPFKIGDIIMFDTPSHKVGPYELMRINGTKGYDHNNDVRDLDCSSYRLATEQEKADYIEKRDAIKIKGYTAKISGRFVEFGCQSYTKDFVIELGKFLLASGLKIESQDEIMKVYNKMK